MTKSPDRLRDERDIVWLRLSARDWTSKQIGDVYGVTSEAVRTVLNRIKAHDAAHGGAA